MMEEVKPYGKNTSKKEQVQKMFNNISEKYDISNTVLSLGIHYYWKKKCVTLLKPYQPKIILDLATGTADLAIFLAKLNPKKIIAADYAEQMLSIAQKKINKKQLSNTIITQKEDGENLSFADHTFDAITISFGIRNFENYIRGITEMHRVLRPGGVLLILEFTLPKNSFLKKLYEFYFRYLLPIIAWFITKDKKAYAYLPNSVAAFPQYSDFAGIIKQCGFKKCEYYPLTGGIATIYLAEK
ncbi:MAG: bifunctional demethylmenaquinone methyltransferase/2-methoxy-6-polyprenyl-1,4-benzoquinol methylase UbiE [Bacteroidia bacterium]|nr:bifunctional demethylmenaquinone methyltransferase/2-methoxy-6-polyprenyl-1,4-benzoquinol methylase UbiE [Bacteroidia bacterium]